MMGMEKTDTINVGGVKKTATEQWCYAGARVDHKHKEFHVWKDELGEEKLFTKNIVRGGVIGALYSVEVERREDGGVTVHGIPRFASSELDPQAPKWQALHKEAKAQIEMHRATKKANPLDELTLAQVREIMRSRLPHQRAGLLAAVIMHIQG